MVKRNVQKSKKKEEKSSSPTKSSKQKANSPKKSSAKGSETKDSTDDEDVHMWDSDDSDDEYMSATSVPVYPSSFDEAKPNIEISGFLLRYRDHAVRMELNKIK
jgi:hypothetical protein